MATVSNLNMSKNNNTYNSYSCSQLHTSLCFQAKSIFNGWKSPQKKTRCIKKDADCFNVAAYTIGPTAEDARNRKASKNWLDTLAICHTAGHQAGAAALGSHAFIL